MAEDEQELLGIVVPGTPEAEYDQGTGWAARLGRTSAVRGIRKVFAKVPNRVWALIFAALVLLFPVIIQNGYWVRIGATVSLYVVLGIGLTIVAQYAGLLDMGYTAFYGIGAYTYALLASPHYNIHLTFWLILPISMVAAMLMGLLIGSPTLRVRGDYLAIVTLAFGQIFQLLLKNLDQPINITNGPNGIVKVDPPRFFGVIFSSPQQFYYLLLFFAVVVAVAVARLQFSRTGRAWAGIRDDEITVTNMGVNKAYYKVLAYVCGAAIAGLAGALLASWQGGVFPENFGMGELIAIYCIVVIGGAGSPLGVMLGAIGLTFLGEILRPYGVYRMIIYSLILLIMMRYRPQGMLLTRPRKSKTTVDEALVGVTASSKGLRTTAAPTPASATETSRAAEEELAAMTPGAVSGAKGELLLKVEKLSKAFGGIVAVSNVSFELRRGEILGIIGPNGAGKTTVFNLLTGQYKPDSGSVTFKGKDITGMAAYKVAQAGVARTFQNIRIYRLLSVLDNVMVGAHARLRGGVWGSIIRPPNVARAEKEKEMQALRHLAFFNRALADRKDDFVTELNYADQRRVELSRAMLLDPELLLLDEPAAGMNSAEVDSITRQIGELRDAGYTIILVEHQMPVVMGVSDRIVVMNKGEVLTEGTPAEIQKDEDVIKAYLGTQHEVSVEMKADRSALHTGEPQLKLSEVSAGYGKVRVLKGVSLEVYKGEIVTLLGANAAGKSTTIKTILGYTRATHGTIEFEGNHIEKKSTVDVIKAGMAVVPEGRRIFWRLTVEENLEMGAFSRNDPALVKRGIERAYELFPILKERRSQKGGTLSGGEQQMLAIARAIMTEPRLLLLDEPSMGLSPVLVAQVMETVQQINKEWGTTIFMVEQNANEALKIADRGYVLQTGAIVLSDRAANLLVDDAMKEAYLGG
jgi:ABC-type branched-subunit amino acid transport system ATPase component/ABC-type branched-subunit amino acid transport system permease subunit